MHISITGLKPKGIWGFIRFWTLAIPSFGEAKSAKGNLYSAVKKINGYNCTLSAWENRENSVESRLFRIPGVAPWHVYVMSQARSRS